MDRSSTPHGSFPRLPSPPPGFRLRLANGRFVDPAAGRCLPAGSALILQDGRVAGRPGAPGDSSDPRADATLDLGGRTVIPALANVHCHLQLVLPSLRLGPRGLWLAHRLAARQIAHAAADCLRRGVALVRDAWSEDLRHNRRLVERIRRGELPGPRLLQAVLVSQWGGTFAQPRGPADYVLGTLAGVPPVRRAAPASGVVIFAPDASTREVRATVDRAIDERAAQSIKLYDQRETKLVYAPGPTLMTQAQLDAAADQARRRGVPSELHHVTVESFRRGVRAGVTALAHVPADGPLTAADTAAAVAAGTVLVPTLSLAYDLCWDHPPLPAGSDRSRLARLERLREETAATLARESWVPGLQGAAAQGFTALRAGRTRMLGVIDMGRVFRYFHGIHTHGFDNVARVYTAGGRLACGNDAGAVPRTAAMVGLELTLIDLALRAAGGPGLGGAEALRIATVHAAAVCEPPGTPVAPAPGARADLAVLDADPLADPAVLGRPVAALLVGGRPVFDACGLAAAWRDGRAA
jgi:imidazolonepropionase-like amidohydrolase